jgi:hypothetical protein
VKSCIVVLTSLRRNQVDFSDSGALLKAAESARVHLNPPSVVLLNDEDVSALIRCIMPFLQCDDVASVENCCTPLESFPRTPEVSRSTVPVANHPVIRAMLVEQQRAMARSCRCTRPRSPPLPVTRFASVIMDGRDACPPPLPPAPPPRPSLFMLRTSLTPGNRSPQSSSLTPRCTLPALSLSCLPTLIITQHQRVTSHLHPHHPSPGQNLSHRVLLRPRPAPPRRAARRRQHHVVRACAAASFTVFL